MSGDGRQSYWGSLARAYAELGSPLRPTVEDVAFLEQAAVGWAARNPRGRAAVLQLGVTPELALARWPETTSLVAVDYSAAMIAAVWPGNLPPKRQAVCANWLSLPCRQPAFHIAIGDGSLNCVPYPDGLRAVAAAVHGALCPGGFAALRCYVQPDIQEAPDAVMADMYRGAIPTFHHLKFRLLMALQPGARQGIRVDNVYRFWAACNVDVDALSARTGWSKTEIAMMDLYQGKDTVHTFPTLAEFRGVLSGCFEEVSVRVPSYNMGGRCPTLLLKPRHGC